MQGSSIHILPRNTARKEDLILVTFTTFSQKKMLRYRNSENLHKAIHPGNIGNRAIAAQLLAAGLAGQVTGSADKEQLRQSNAEKMHPAAGADQVQVRLRQSKRQRQDPSWHHSQFSALAADQEPPKDAARKKLRKEKDDAHRLACSALETNSQWVHVESEQYTWEKDGRSMTVQKLKLSEAACCRKFGVKQLL